MINNSEKSSVIFSKDEFLLLTNTIYAEYDQVREIYYSERQSFELFRALYKELYAIYRNAGDKIKDINSIRIVTDNNILITFRDCINRKIEQCKKMTVRSVYNYFYNILDDSSHGLHRVITQLDNIKLINNEPKIKEELLASYLFEDESKVVFHKLETYLHMRFLLEESLNTTCQVEQFKNHMLMIPIINGEQLQNYEAINHQKPTVKLSNCNTYITAKRDFGGFELEEDSDDFNYYDYHNDDDYDYEDMSDYY